MLLFDTNVLVYAANKDSTFHLPCRRRLDDARGDPSPAFLIWSICYEFLRVTTHQDHFTPAVLGTQSAHRQWWRFPSMVRSASAPQGLSISMPILQIA